MSTPRMLAASLLNAVIRHSSSASQEWANAMLRELDFIENDWVALFWAIGSTTAIFRHSVPRRVKAWFGKRANQKEGVMSESIGKKTAGVISGIAIAVGVIACAFGIVWLLFSLFPKSELGPGELWIGIVMIVIPEVIFIVSAVMVWRKKRFMAVGIMLSAAVLATHAIIHLATRVR